MVFIHISNTTCSYKHNKAHYIIINPILRYAQYILNVSELKVVRAVLH